MTSTRRPTRPRWRLSAATAAAALVLAGCGGTGDAGDAGDATPSAVTPSGQDVAPTPAEAAPTTDTGTADRADEQADPEVAEDAPAAPSSPVLAAVATAPDGSTFTIGDLAGRTVLVETMATWCSNCRRQLGDTQSVAAEVGDDVAVVALSVETSLDPAALEAYAADNGFTDVTFGVLDPEGLAAFQEAFGTTVLNPPSTPKFVVAPDGTIGELVTGFESPEQLREGIAAAAT